MPPTASHRRAAPSPSTAGHTEEGQQRHQVGGQQVPLTHRHQIAHPIESVSTLRQASLSNTNVPLVLWSLPRRLWCRRRRVGRVGGYGDCWIVTVHDWSSSPAKSTHSHRYRTHTSRRLRWASRGKQPPPLCVCRRLACTSIPPSFWRLIAAPSSITDCSLVCALLKSLDVR
jgi:hypothetical protein